MKLELRTVDPRILRFNPNNPRRTKSTREADAMLEASIKALGYLLQPPTVYEDEKGLEIKYGERRVRAALRLEFPEIPILVAPRDEKADAMAAVVENVARDPLPPVDQWRGVEKLIALDWTEDAIAMALALPLRTIRKLRLLANIHPSMLDQMTKGDIPDERRLRIIAAASQQEQAQVWKKRKPKKNETADWHQIATALEKRRLSASVARFGDELAQAYGIAWSEDLFEQASEDNRYTTNVEAFFGAQQEWLGNNLPARGIILTEDQYGNPALPKGAERLYGKPGKTDYTGWYVNARTGAVESIAYRSRPEIKAKGKTKRDGAPAPRPPLTQKGAAMLGDLRTDALHQALREAPVESETLLALMALAFGSQNVSVTSPSNERPSFRSGRTEAVVPLIVDGALTVDGRAIAKAAREMLAGVLSCRENASKSGVSATLAGAALGADDFLPNFATADFVVCMSREEVERVAREARVPLRTKLKDTRADLVAHFAKERFIPDMARFLPTAAELKKITDYQVIDADDTQDDAEDGAQAVTGEDGLGEEHADDAFDEAGGDDPSEDEDGFQREAAE
jgi:ParB family chromosome partitioning protein